MAGQVTNVGHVDMDEVAHNLLTGLTDGIYEAQFNAVGLRYFVGGAAAPADVDDYIPMLERGTLRFRAETGATPIWVRATHAAVGGPVAFRRLPRGTPAPSAMALGRPHFDATTTAADIRGTLPAGDYRGNVTRVARDDAVLIATATNAPDEVDDFWRPGRGPSFLFCAGPGTEPTWVRTLTGAAVVAIDGGPA